MTETADQYQASPCPRLLPSGVFDIPLSSTVPREYLLSAREPDAATQCRLPLITMMAVWKLVVLRRSFVINEHERN